MKIAILGAGVIGFTYGFFLHEAGHQVTVVARGTRARKFKNQRLTMSDGLTGVVKNYDPEIALAVPAQTELILVAVQIEQLAPAVASLLQDDANSSILTLANAPMGLSAVVEAGKGRVVAAFPGMGGYFAEDFHIRYVQIADQPTTLGQSLLNSPGQITSIASVLKSAGCKIAICDNMDDWLKTHAVFICALGGALKKAGGAVVLADDKQAVRAMIKAADEGFRALSQQGISIMPNKLKLIFSRVPRFIAVPFWAKLLRTPSFTVGFEPHVKAAVREMDVMARDVQHLTRASAQALPNLHAALDVLRQRPQSREY